MDLEIKRQVVHASGILTILLIQIFGRFLSALMVLAIATAFWFAAYYRLHKKTIKLNMPKEIEKVEAFIYREFERPKDFPMKGAITFYIGTFLAIAIFPQNISIPSIIVLALADSVSTIIGKFFGKHKLPVNRNKTWEGSSAFFIASLGVLILFVEPITALTISLIATFVEMLPKINDNIAIPLVVGVLLSLA